MVPAHIYTPRAGGLKWNTLFTRKWEPVGSKTNLCEELCSITNIDEAVLRNPEEVQSCSVAKRMSWASLRDAKEVGKEDLAYCLIGIFRVPHLFVRYNGLTNAMLSLQLEIMKEYQDDLSIFEWQHTDINDPCTNGLLAGSPFKFHLCGEIKTFNNGSKINLASDSAGMLSIHGLTISQPLGRVGLVLNSYQNDIRLRM
ncbi:hypothetical protein BDV39DRAFT_204019 [Aspergillus sergii]|uniref:Uncharacterized protein n=1 Tax=Aspergillus sergii TaxID=1034303 RepID=A0A5N6X8N3_9EURO|nr:hypothetical protein BDV39DRAFT_204019 [Aspergillus sergii]